MSLKIKKNETFSFLIFSVLLVSIFSLFSPTTTALPTEEDAYEENDTLSTAYPVSPGTLYNLSLHDPDFYVITLSRNDVLQISITYDSLYQNISLSLYDYSSVIVNSSDSRTGFEEVWWNATYSGEYYINVDTPDAFYANESYNLTITYISSSLPDDWAEDNDILSNATYVSENYYANLIQYDEDYYQLYVGTENTIIVNLIYNTTVGNLTATLYDVNFLPLAYSSFNETLGGATLEFIPSEGKQCYILVDGDSFGFVYDMEIKIIAPGNIDDIYEDNDDFSTRYQSLEIGRTYDNLALLDPDFYSIYTDADSFVQVNVSFDSQFASPVLRVYTSTNSLIIEVNEANTDFLTATFQVLTSYYYVIEVNDNANWTGNYSLSIGYKAPEDDYMEDNDDFYSAYPLTVYNEYTNLVLEDPDWYIINLDNFDMSCALRITIYLEDLSPINVFAGLYDENRGELATAREDGDGNLFVELDPYDFPTGTIYFLIEFSSVNPPDVPAFADRPYSYYSLDVSDTCSIECQNDDFMEDNDFASDAWGINEGTYNSLVLCDEDYYLITLDQGTLITVTLTYSVDGNIDMELMGIDSTGEEYLIEGYNLSYNRGETKITWNATESDDYLIVVHCTPELRGIFYSMSIDLGSPDTTSGGEVSDETTSNPDAPTPFAAIAGYPLEYFLIFTFSSITFFLKKKRAQR